jgi:hypothetical protein
MPQLPSAYGGVDLRSPRQGYGARLHYLRVPTLRSIGKVPSRRELARARRLAIRLTSRKAPPPAGPRQEVATKATINPPRNVAPPPGLPTYGTVVTGVYQPRTTPTGELPAVRPTGRPSGSRTNNHLMRMTSMSDFSASPPEEAHLPKPAIPTQANRLGLGTVGWKPSAKPH